MSDFYKGYYEDRYSFGHADKKWYSQNKDHVKQYNHDYYQKHKKISITQDITTYKDEDGSQWLTNEAEEVIQNAKPGQILKTQYGDYAVVFPPAVWTTIHGDKVSHHVNSSENSLEVVSESGLKNNLSGAILLSMIARKDDERRRNYAKQDMDKVLDILHRFGSKGRKPNGKQ